MIDGTIQLRFLFKKGDMHLVNSSHDPSSCVIPTLNCPLLQISKPTAEGDTETQKLREWLPVLQDLARADQEGISPANRSNSGDNQLLSEESGVQQSGTITPIFFFLL